MAKKAEQVTEPKTDDRKTVKAGDRIGPLKRDQHQALRMHRLLSAQEEKQIASIAKGAQGRWVDLVLGAVEAHGHSLEGLDSLTARDVVDDEGNVFYEFAAAPQKEPK